MNKKPQPKFNDYKDFSFALDNIKLFILGLSVVGVIACFLLLFGRWLWVLLKSMST